jgi:hypothetical protein
VRSCVPLAASRRPGLSKNKKPAFGKQKQALSFAATQRAGRAKTFTLSSFLKDENSVSKWSGREATMKSPLVIVLVAVVLVAVGTLTVMNNACKSSQHAWCAPTSSF